MLTKRPAIITAIALALLLAGCARQARREEGRTAAGDNASTTPVRVSAENADAAEPSIAPALDGTIFIAWVEHLQNKEANVMLAHLDREGRSIGPPARVNPKAGEATAWRGDPPTVAVGADGSVYVGWTARLPGEQGHANDLYLSASRDEGQTFEPPVKVNDDGKKVVHAMHSLAVGRDQRVYLAWLDERNVVAPSAGKGGMKMDHMEANREVFFVASADGGHTFSANRRLAKDACPCCKTALAVGADDRVYASWRQVLPGEFRHIALASSNDGGKTFTEPKIVSDDRWMTASCPVSGPALSAGASGSLRVVWYTEGDKGTPGLYWAESRDGGQTFSESRPLAAGQSRGNPLLLMSMARGTTVVWESDETGSSRVMYAPLEDKAQASPLVESGELPAATVSGDQLFIGYISKADDRRSIWLVRSKTTA
ncbi:MAG TPA: sialidase family protein [Pyrinomonadaceae bacterium]|jgi:hypothetical protein